LVYVPVDTITGVPTELNVPCGTGLTEMGPFLSGMAFQGNITKIGSDAGELICRHSNTGEAQLNMFGQRNEQP